MPGLFSISSAVITDIEAGAVVNGVSVRVAVTTICSSVFGEVAAACALTAIDEQMRVTAVVSG
jgi:hypothetical protein